MSETRIFDDYWKRMQLANPALNVPATTMRMSVESFRSQLEKAWLAAKGGPITGRIDGIMQALDRMTEKGATKHNA